MSKKPIKILLADDNKEFIDLIKGFIEEEPDMKVEAIAYDGLQTLEKLEKHDLDILVLDIVMPEIDGLGILKRLKESDYLKKPYTIMLTAVGQDSITRRAMDLGADYYMLKPFDYKFFIDIIRQAQNEDFLNGGIYNHSIESKIKDTLNKMGIPSNLNGYEYLLEGIYMAIKDKSCLIGITKNLYSEIAKKKNTTSLRVERSIRHAIKVGWDSSNRNSELDEFFLLVNEDNKPTNSEFIAIVADKLRAFDK